MFSLSLFFPSLPPSRLPSLSWSGPQILSGGHSLILPLPWSISGGLPLPWGPLISKLQPHFQLAAESSHGKIWKFFILLHVSQGPSCCYGGSPKEYCLISPTLKIEYPLNCFSYTFLDVSKISHLKHTHTHTHMRLTNFTLWRFGFEPRSLWLQNPCHYSIESSHIWKHADIIRFTYW